jgi:hypothetical protein
VGLNWGKSSSSCLLFVHNSCGRLALLHFMLRLADGCVNLSFDFFNDTSAVEFAFYDFICLQEPLKFTGQLVVLAGYQVHVLV